MALASKLSARLVVSVALVAAVAVRPGGPLSAEEATHTISGPLLKPLKDARADLHAKRYAEAIAKLKAAEIIRGKAPYDQHLINDMLTYSYIKTNDFADAAKTMEAEVGDGFTPQSDIPRKVRGLAEINYQLKKYDTAIAYGRRAIKDGHGDETMENVVGQAYYLKGDWKATRDFEDGLVTAAIKQGERPRKALLQLLYSACVRLQDKQCAALALQRLNGGAWRPDLIPPPVPVGNMLVYYFGLPQDLDNQKRLPTSAPPSTAK